MQPRSSSRTRPGACLPVFAVGAGLGLAALAPTAAHAGGKTYAYTLTIIGPPGVSSDGFAVNDSGQVAGDFGSGSAYLTAPNGGALKYLGTLPGGYVSAGRGVNDAGQVTGYSAPQDGPAHAFLSGPNGGALKDLGTLPGEDASQGFGVNAKGQVTGYSYSSASGYGLQAFYSNGVMHDLGALPGGGSSIGRGINDAGQVTGDSGNHAFLSGKGGGALQDLGTLGGRLSEGDAVNAGGEVAGFSYTASNHEHAFLYSNGVMHDIGTLRFGTYSFATGINDSGMVVGSSNTTNSAIHAFVFSGGVMTDLNSLIAPGSGFTLREADGISNTGFITGYGLDSQGYSRPFLLTPSSPVPEASSVVSLGLLLALGLGGVAVARRRRAA